MDALLFTKRLEQTFLRSNQQKVTPVPVWIFDSLKTTKVQLEDRTCFSK